MINICISGGIVDSNIYIVGDKGEAVVIDCGVDAQKIYDTAKDNGLVIKYIVLTHCHFDHVFYSDKLKQLTGAKVIMQKIDAANINNSNSAIMKRLELNMNVSDPDITVEDGDEISVGGHIFKFIHTPGHTSGCICISVEDVLFSGDTLFRLSVGRTDLGDGDFDTLVKSVKRLYDLPASTKVFSGHGESTTIGFESKNNPYVIKGDNT